MGVGSAVATPAGALGMSSQLCSEAREKLLETSLDLHINITLHTHTYIYIVVNSNNNPRNELK